MNTTNQGEQIWELGFYVKGERYKAPTNLYLIEITKLETLRFMRCYILGTDFLFNYGRKTICLGIFTIF